MLKNVLITTILLSSTLVSQKTPQSTEDVLANSCKEFTVTAIDGYANVRSTSEVRKNTVNIVGVLVTGTKIKITGKDGNWAKINLPITGFISRSQITNISCDDAMKLLMKTGVETIARLGSQATQNNSQAAQTLIRIANNGTDGAISEFYSFTIANWADKNPVFLISMLKKEPIYIYKPFLRLLNFETGTPHERENFERTLAKLPLNDPIAKYWFSIKQGQ